MVLMNDVALPQPALIANQADFVLHLDRLRRRAIRAGGQRVGLDRLSRLTGIPRSSLHGYLVGLTLPPPDRLDALVVALGSTPSETHEWAQALDRLVDAALDVRRTDDQWLELPSGHEAVRRRRSVGLADCPERGGDDATGPVGPSVLSAHVCSTWTGTYVYAEPTLLSPRTGFLLPGNNWFLCQAVGALNPPLGEAVASDIWLFTQGDRAYSDQGGWGWAPATAVAGAEPFTPLPGLRWRESKA